ncbi:MAG TPA: glycoside hydrolase family 32 protein, partial [Sediminibacterium sp.]|nr:glycoside hydrolase family 32 protein [Sediminibacterium sp.]
MRYRLILLSLFSVLQVAAQDKPYHEPYRPQLHFSPPAHWMNDPNGLVYADHTYHLFYQYYPDSTVWGPMHWGHAVSKDLLHWQNLPIALYPDSLGYIFSGSAVADSLNSSGLKKGNQAPLIAMFTYHDPAKEKAGRNDFQYQGIAFSHDGGFHWQKYRSNPVISNPGARDFRDPKLRWYAPSHQWICTLAAGDEIRFYHSPDLIHWTYGSSFGKGWGSHGGVWECPDLISFRTNEGTKWVLIVNIGNGGPAGGSGTQYFVGNFN